MEITPKFNFVEGSFNTEDIEMLCIADENHGTVELCVCDGGWNIPIAKIKLHSKDLYVDFKATLGDAKRLGDEIARRWNECQNKK